jgi:colanic acid/amylovoran biosynthesis glycosyltransferase
MHGLSEQRSSRSPKRSIEDARDSAPETPGSALRVAFFVSSFPELSETFILRQAVGLLDRGHHVRIFAHAPATEGLVHESVEQRGLRAAVTVLSNGVGPRRAELPSAREALTLLRCLGPRQASATGGWGALARTIAALAREGAFDVVHCHYGNVALHYACASCVWDAPLVASFYGYDCSSYPRKRGVRVYEPLFAIADAVTSLSEYMDARLRSLGCPPGLLRRVPLSVDPTALSALEAPRARPVGEVRLLTVARLTEKKGLEYALRALAILMTEHSGLRYDIIGDGALRPQLEALADALGVRDRVRFLGPRTESEVALAMHEADVFLLPSVTAATGDEEGTPTVLLEAAAARLPVITTHHAGIPEIVRQDENGILVPERDPEAIADALRSLIRAPERWPALGDAGHRLVQESHTVPIVAERLETMYRELIRARSHQRRSPSGSGR